MVQTIEALFDGEVFRPNTPPKLKPNTVCELTIESRDDAPYPDDAWAYLESIAGSVDMPEDWSEEHDHYLYGSPKRSTRK